MSNYGNHITVLLSFSKPFFLQQDEIQAYGIDIEGPVPDDHDDGSNAVEVPITSNPLESNHYQQMCAAIDPLRPSDSYGIDIYMEVSKHMQLQDETFHCQNLYLFLNCKFDNLNKLQSNHQNNLLNIITKMIAIKAIIDFLE